MRVQWDLTFTLCCAIQIEWVNIELLNRRISEGNFTITFELLNLIFALNQLLSNQEARTKSARLSWFWFESASVSYVSIGVWL